MLLWTGLNAGLAVGSALLLWRSAVLARRAKASLERARAMLLEARRALGTAAAVRMTLDRFNAEEGEGPGAVTGAGPPSKSAGSPAFSGVNRCAEPWIGL